MKNPILEHMRTDPNASDHAQIGALASMVSFLLIGGITENMEYALWAFFLGGFVAGIGIESQQRWDRRGGTQNTWKESALDILVTGCWYLWPLR